MVVLTPIVTLDKPIFSCASVYFGYRKISNIRCTKSPKLIIPHLVLQLSLRNPMKPGVRSRIKMLLEQRRQAMLQLHLSDRQVYCLLRCAPYIRDLTVIVLNNRFYVDPILICGNHTTSITLTFDLYIHINLYSLLSLTYFSSISFTWVVLTLLCISILNKHTFTTYDAFPTKVQSYDDYILIKTRCGISTISGKLSRHILYTKIFHW